MSDISIKDLAVSFGSVKVLESLNLEVQSGEFIVLLGASGCGKSTLLNSIAGLIDVTSGQIWIDGENVTWMEPGQRKIGMVFQSYALYPTMDVYGNLSFGLKMAGVAKAEIDKRVKEAARILQIDNLLDRRPAELSGGQRQRVAIGRALVRSVNVFLFDEPLSNLDAKLRTELRIEIKRLHNELGATMVFVTHDQVEALTLADRIVVMDKGVVQQIDTPEAIYRSPANMFVAGFVGSPAMNFVSGTLKQSAQGAIFVSKDGETHPLPDYEPSRPVVDGESATLGIRPEMCSPDSDGYAGKVNWDGDMIESVGLETIGWGSVDGEKFAVRNPAGKLNLAQGRQTVFYDRSSVSLFDAKGVRI